MARTTVHCGDDPVPALAVGILATEVSVALQAEPAHPEPIEVRWAAKHPVTNIGGVVSCRIRANGHRRVHRFEVLIPVSNKAVAMFVDADAVVVSGNTNLDAGTASGADEVGDVLLVVPIDHEFWAALLEVRISDSFAGTTP